MIPRVMTILITVAMSSGCALFVRPPTLQEAAQTPGLPKFNRLVLEVCQDYPTDGTHGYWWPKADEESEHRGYDGCTRDVYFLGEKVMDGEPEGRTYCCGYTLEVFAEAYSRWLKENGVEASSLTPETWRRFQRLWFVLELNGPGPNIALEEYGLGRTIDVEDWDTLLPGDFCNLWRTEQDSGKISGHSVIFLGWVRDREGEIRGMHYFSSQPSTDGIGYRTEWFGANGGVSRHYTHFGRAEPPEREEI